MNPLIKTGTRISVLFLLLSAAAAQAQMIDDTFTYQGYLEFEGQPAEGPHDFLVYLIDEDTFATALNTISTNTFENQPVIQGLFSLELNFDDGVFDGTQYWLDVRVRQAGGPSYTVFNGAQRLNAVPYATQAQGGGGGNDLFESNSNGIGYAAGRFEVGGAPSSGNSLFQVDAASGVSPLRARVDGSTRLMVHPNGGTSLGFNNPAVPDNGLQVRGDSVFEGNVSQPVESSGIVKAGIVATCSNSSAINRSFNNVNGDAIVIDPSIALGTGSCAFTIPFDLDQVFLQATVIRQNDTRIVSCSNPDSDTLICNVSDTSGTNQNSVIHILLY